MPQPYPDISKILAAKQERRKALAALSWEEKVAIIKRMRLVVPKGMWKDKPADETSPRLHRDSRG